MNFEFATAHRIVFGPGRLKELPGLAEGLGSRALVGTGKGVHRPARLLELLQSTGVTPVMWVVPGEPTVTDVQAGVNLARQERCDFVIGFGGGSVIDGAKAVAAMLTNTGDLFDYLEVIGRAQPLGRAGAPFIAIPTTAGTGAEVTRNAVLGSPEHRVKVSLRSPLMLARIALIDPELTHDLPPDLTASTGMDALTQLIEPFVSCRANPFTDALCRQALPLVARSLMKAFEGGNCPEAREEMSLASLCGGLALANAGLGAVHGFAGPVGGMFPVPHGVVCAALLAPVMAANLRALRARCPASPSLGKFGEVARLLTSNADARADEAVEWVEALCGRLHIPKLGTFGISEQHFSGLTEAAARSSSMKANPIALTSDELRAALRQAI